MNALRNFSVTMESFRTDLSLHDPATLLEGLDPGTCLFITDSSVLAALDDPRLPSAIRAAWRALPPERCLVLEAGETAKNWDSVQAILQKGFSLGMARDSRMVGLGGGVVTDIVAFAASLYMRGCQVTLVPTTVLAMVDAAFGGKTGMNFGGWKNMVGTFYPAGEVRVCPAFCATLPDREYLGGLAEVVKSALLDDRDLWAWLQLNREGVLARHPGALERLVWDSLMVKARVVQADLREKSIRAHLNLGHTFAHGLESAAGFGVWNHGAAVAWGMVRAALLAQRLGICDAAWAGGVRKVLEEYGFVTRVDVPGQAILAAMHMDKKKKDGQVRHILQRGLCDTLTRPVDDADVLAVLAMD